MKKINFEIYHLINNDKWHVYWNLFLPTYKHWGINSFLCWHNYSTAFYFGTGEFVIDAKEANLIYKFFSWLEGKKK